MPVYAASKLAVIGMVRSLARDHGKEGIRVNALVPGWIMTERQLTLWLTPEADAMRAERQALKRRLMPEEVARVALFLISKESGGMTGQRSVVDRGCPGVAPGVSARGLRFRRLGGAEEPAALGDEHDGEAERGRRRRSRRGAA